MDNVKEKIRKLLLLADNEKNPNFQECASALKKAQELMIKNNLTMSDIEKEEHDKVAKTTILNKNRFMWYEKYLSKVISENFRCSWFIDSNQEIKFLGLEQDVEIAKETYLYVLKYVKICWDKFKKPNSSIKDKNDYYVGFLKGVEETLKKQVEENNYSLMLIKDQLVIQETEKLGLIYVKPSGISPQRGNNRDLINEGYRDGLAINERKLED